MEEANKECWNNKKSEALKDLIIWLDEQYYAILLFILFYFYLEFLIQFKFICFYSYSSVKVGGKNLTEYGILKKGKKKKT